MSLEPVVDWVLRAVGGLAALAGFIWATVQIHDRLVVRLKVRVHPGILFRKPHNFEDTFRRIVTEGGDPTRVIATRPPEFAIASAQSFADVPAGASSERRALFVRAYNYSPKRRITVSQVWFEGLHHARVPMDGPAGPWEVPPESYRETWVLVEKLPSSIPKEEHYQRFRAQVVGRRAPVTSVMADPNEVGPRGDVAIAAAPAKEY